MTTDKKLIEVAKEKYNEVTNPLLDMVQRWQRNAFIDGAEFQKTRWNEGVNVPDDEHEKGAVRDILIFNEKSRDIFTGWYNTDKGCYHRWDEHVEIKPETIMWQEIYLPE